MYSCTDKKCKSKTLGDALDLINRQKAEIERLSNEVKSVTECKFESVSQAAKAEAYEEFAERLDNETFGVYYASSLYHVVDIDDVKEILKELVGDK